MLVLLAFLGSTIGAVAQNYPVAVSESTTITNETRVVSGVTLQPERGLLQSTAVKEGRLAYNDMTETANGTFKIKAGQTVYPKFVFSQWDGRTGVDMGDWMHSYLFVDTNDNKVFDVSGKDVADDELLAYYKSSDRTYTNDLDGFSISKTGTFRMRYLIVWNTSANSETSKGNTGIPSDGGIIVDVNLQVEAVEVASVGAEVTYDTAPVCGQAFTFSVPTRTGFATAVSVKCGDEFDAEQTTSTISYKTKSSVTTYNWEQFTPTDNGNGTYTVPANKMKGDLQITVTYSKDVMALIKAGKQVFKIKNRSYSATMPYLIVSTTDVADESSATDRVPYNKPILYHTTDAANNASYLWKLKPTGTDEQYYLCSQGLKAVLSPRANVTVQLAENGTPVKLFSSTSGYYGIAPATTTALTATTFLHAVAFGKTAARDTYCSSQIGDYVTYWNFQNNGSDTQPSQWTFEAVDEIGITIGTSGYASVNYDFPVKFPAGVKVYKKAEEAATYIRLAEITPGADGCVSLPTGNAAFVAGTEGESMTLSILLDEPEAIDGGTGVNGTYLATTFGEDDAANIYGIAKVNDVVAFYKMKANTTIKQNKGYIRSTSSNAPRMELTFSEGETTGIESMLEDNSRRESIDTSVLYDLNGRRVLYPSRGIYVTAGGQRIFLK